MSEVDDLIAETPPLGQAWRSGRGIIESDKKLSKWAMELLEKSRDNPAISRQYVTDILKALCKKHNMPIGERITYGLVNSWWRRNQ